MAGSLRRVISHINIVIIDKVCKKLQQVISVSLTANNIATEICARILFL